MNLATLTAKAQASGLTHELMLEFFRLMPTNSGPEILVTFVHWAEPFEKDEWYERVIDDYNRHGRLTAETLIQADPAPVITLGDDNATN